MKRRLRKKRRLGEFTEFGFRLRFVMSRSLDESARIAMLGEFLEEIERLGLQFGGGGIHDLGRLRRILWPWHSNRTNRTAILYWLEQHPDIENPVAGELVDAWHGWD